MKYRLKSSAESAGRMLIVEADKDDELAYVDAERVYRGDLDPFLFFTYARGSRAYEFAYYLGPGISLDRVLSAPVMPDTLRSMLGSLLHMMQACEACGLSRLRVVLDPKYVYFDPVAAMLKFAYVPMRSYVTEVGEAELISRICSATMADDGDRQFAVSVWDFVHRTTILTSVALEDFLKSWGLQTPDSAQRRMRKTASALDADTRANHGWDFVAALRENEVRRRFERDELGGSVDALDSFGGAGGRVFVVHVSSGEAYALGVGCNVLGRAGDCTVPLPNLKSISRRHAEIIVRDGEAVLRDLKSTNGTFVGERCLGPGQEARLNSGDCFALGEEAFRLIDQPAGA